MKDWVVVIFCLAAFLLAPSPSHAQPASITGPELAAKARALRPDRPAAFSAVLKIRPHKQATLTLPIMLKVELAPDSWRRIYECRHSGQVEQLIVIHMPSRPNEYLYARVDNNKESARDPQPVEPSALSRPFAGSDFWLCDLGQEFFHWPEQRILKNEMRKSRSCKVLESRPAPGSDHPYSRVLSWLDNETGGLVMAEAYDRDNRLLKEFEVRNVRKIEEEYRADLQIWNVQTKSRTRLEFEEK